MSVVSLRLNEIAAIADLIATIAANNDVGSLQDHTLCTAALAINEKAIDALAAVETASVCRYCSTSPKPEQPEGGRQGNDEKSTRPRLVPIRRMAPADVEPDHAQ